jgi:predicted lipoprotein with Yx(FWY)xxD motif
VTKTTTSTQISTSVQTLASPAFTVSIGYNSSIGYYITNGTGFTLYMFKVDKPNNGTSACYGKCAAAWPAFYASDTKAPPGIDASSFGVITRINGTKQSTYNGWPLYYFYKDTKAGNVIGQGLFKVWFAYPLPVASAVSSTTKT